MMSLYLGSLIFSFVFTSVLIVPFIDFLYRKKLVRQTEKERVEVGSSAEYKKLTDMHSRKAGTPTGLGVLLVTVILVYFSFLFLVLKPVVVWTGVLSGFDTTREILVIIVAFLGFGLLGLYDDLMKIFGFSRTGFFGLRRWHKFSLQWIVALVVASMLYFGLGISIVNIPLVGVVNLGWGYLLLAAFLLVTFANAFDITSGLDGLGEGLLMICLLAFWVISVTQLDGVLSLFIAVWLGSLIAGIYFTVHPARAFLGNASGMAFGATLALLGLLSGKVVALLVVGVPFLIDGGSSLVQIFGKNVLKRRIFPIAPLHHWLEILGWEEPKIVARAWLTGLVLAIFGVWLAFI